MCEIKKTYAKACVYCHRDWQAKCPKARYCSTRCQYLASGRRVIMSCKQCSDDFECKAMEMRAGRQFCSKACMLNARRRQSKPCIHCGSRFIFKPKKDPSKGKGLYCSKQCAGAARRSGKRKGRWKEAQELRACRAKIKPSQRMCAAIKSAISKQIQAISSLRDAVRDYRPCLHCGGSLKAHATNRTVFCSIPCSAAYEHKIKCRVCGKQCVKRGVQGGRGMCTECKRIAKKANKRQGYRRKLTKICTRDGWRCQLCSCRLLKTWNLDAEGVPLSRCRTIDHILPRADGGTDDDWNLQACCYKCNCKKGSKHRGQLRFAM